MTDVDFKDWTVPSELWEALRPLLHAGMLTLETGSGLSTELFEAVGCRHTALEHDRRFAPRCESVVIAPLLGEPPWYDWSPPHPYELILIDGPPKDAGGRCGILRVVDRLVHRRTILVLDDTNRPEEDRLASELAHRFGFGRVDGKASDRRRFSILRREQGAGG